MAHGFAVFAGLPPDTIRAVAREVEALSYSSFWVNYPGPVDGLAVLGLAAAETRRIPLGVGVIPLHTRGPASIVDGVRTGGIDAGRLLLGVGSPNPGSLGRVRDGVAELRAKLPGIRLVVAALGPKMCRLAGEIADGVLLNWLTAEHARRASAWVGDGAAAAGRPRPTLFAYVRVALGAAAIERLADEGDRYAQIPAYAAHFDRMEVKPIETAIAAPTPAAIGAGVAAWSGAVDEVVLRAVTATDRVEEMLALVRAARPAARATEASGRSEHRAPPRSG